MSKQQRFDVTVNKKVRTEGWRDFQFEDGDIIFVRSRRSWLGRLIRLSLSDFDYEHVCQWFDGHIYTTGKGGFPRYAFGAVNPEKYLAKKTIAIGRYQGLTSIQKEVMAKVAEYLRGSPYPWWKVMVLVIQGKLSARVVRKVGFKVTPNPKYVFCASAVALGLLRAGLTITEKYTKLEPDAYTPETLYDSPFIDILYREGMIQSRDERERLS